MNSVSVGGGAERIVCAIIRQITDSIFISDKTEDTASQGGDYADGIRVQEVEEDHRTESVADSEVESALIDTSTPRRSRRKKKLTYLSPQHQELRRLAKIGEYQPLKEFLANSQDIAENINITDEEGNTVLNDIAIRNAQFVKVAQLLIEHKADVNVADQLGNSALHNAMLYYPASAEMVHLLIASGADVQQRNTDKCTPLQMPDDDHLQTFIARSGVSDPMLLLHTYLESLSKPNKVTPAKVKYKALPASPYKGILKTNHQTSGLKKGDQLEPKLTAANNCDLSTASDTANGTSSLTLVGKSPAATTTIPLLATKNVNSDYETGSRKRRRESDGCSPPRKKRIRFAESDSTGSSIDPTFSGEEETE